MKKSALTIVLAAAVTASSFTAVSAAEADRQPLTAAAPAAYTLSVNGKTAGIKYEVYKENDKIMVPLRFVAENLGFKVEWDEENQAVRLDNGTVNTIVRIGDDSYYMASSKAIGMSAPTPLGAAPVVKGDFTYVPADMFNILCGKTAYSAENNAISFNLDEDEPSAQMPSPFKEYNTTADARKSLAFETKVPSKMPNGYKLTYIATISDEVLQLTYENDGKEICYRTAKGGDDISGDYNIYKDIKELTADGKKLKYRENGETSGAVWTDGDMTYSIFSTGVLSEKDVIDIAASIR